MSSKVPSVLVLSLDLLSLTQSIASRVKEGLWLETETVRLSMREDIPPSNAVLIGMENGTRRSMSM